MIDNEQSRRGLLDKKGERLGLGPGSPGAPVLSLRVLTTEKDETMVRSREGEDLGPRQKTSGERHVAAVIVLS